MSTRCLIAITVAGLTVTGGSILPVQAQRGTESPPAWKEQLLLGDRLRIDAPVNANVEPRRDGIMGPVSDPASETRMRIAILGTEMVVQARSLDAFAPTDLSAGIRSTKYFAEFAGTKHARVLDLGPRWKAVALFPERNRFWKDSYILAYVWVQSPDGLLFDLMVGSWADSAKYAQLAQAAVQIASSLRPGIHSPDIPKGMTSLESQVGIDLVIDLDGKHVLRTEKGHDFVVHRISPLVEYGSPSGELGIYLGRYPQFDRKEELRQGSKTMTDQLEILGGKPTWYVRESDGSRTQTTLIQISSGRRPLQAHLFISGTPHQVDTLVGLARTLRLRPKG